MLKKVIFSPMQTGFKSLWQLISESLADMSGKFVLVWKGFVTLNLQRVLFLGNLYTPLYDVDTFEMHVSRTTICLKGLSEWSLKSSC